MNTTAEDSPSLYKQLEDYKSKFLEESEKVVIEAYEDGIAEVFESGILERAIQSGDEAPDFDLKNATGKSVNLYDSLEEGPVVLMWYRGGWCPYCNLTLRAYQNILPEIHENGAQLMALTPEIPDKSLSTIDKHSLEFQVLTDHQNRVARGYGLVFQVPEYVNRYYKRKFDLAEYAGDDAYELPLAATYIIGQDGIVEYDFLSADYRERAEPDEIIEILEEL